MLRRARHAVLLAHRAVVARADVDLRAAEPLLALRRGERPADDSLAALAEAAAGVEPLPPSVWVLSDEVVLQTIELDARAVKGLAHAELGSALCYEAQKLTGLPASEAVTAWRAAGPDSGGTRAFLVSQVARGELERLGEMVERRGGRLAGLLHPAGLPARLSAEGNGRFRRVETWDEVVAEVESDGSGGVSVRVLPSGLHESLREGAKPTELLDATTTSAVAGSARAALRLDDEALLARWQEAWARELTRRAPAVPVLAAPSQPASRTARIAWSVAGLLAVGALVAWDDDRLRERKVALGTEMVALREPIDRLARAAADAASARRELDELLASAPAATTGPRWSADLPARLLSVLATSRPAGLVVTGLELEWRSSRVHGEALSPDVVDQLAGAVAAELHGTGYDVSAVGKQLRDDGLYDFEIDLAPLDAAPLQAHAMEEAR